MGCGYFGHVLHSLKFKITGLRRCLDSKIARTEGMQEFNSILKEHENNHPSNLNNYAIFVALYVRFPKKNNKKMLTVSRSLNEFGFS